MPDQPVASTMKAPDSMLAWSRMTGDIWTAVLRTRLGGSAMWYRTPVEYQLDREKISRLTSQREREWAEVNDYLDHSGCLMAYLRQALDDPESSPCGHCANCAGKPLLPAEIDHGLGVRAAQFLQHSEMPLKLNIQVASGAFEVYELRGNLPQDLRAETGRVLARWGDAGWGRAGIDVLCVLAAEAFTQKRHCSGQPSGLGRELLVGFLERVVLRGQLEEARKPPA